MLMLTIASLACGFIFGLGLLVSGMLQPTKVLGFLDIFGVWDPSLAVVMAAALVVSNAGFILARRRQRPIFATRSLWPTKHYIDRPLVFWVGSVRCWLGSRGTVSWASLGKSRHALAARHRLCRRHGSRNANTQSLPEIQRRADAERSPRGCGFGWISLSHNWTVVLPRIRLRYNE